MRLMILAEQIYSDSVLSDRPTIFSYGFVHICYGTKHLCGTDTNLSVHKLQVIQCNKVAH